jgi:uncharacterized protein YuzE
MTVTIAGTSFDQHEYDEHGDVLYLSVGSPHEAARTIATPEGHAVDYDESGAVIGMVLVNVRFLLERDGLSRSRSRRITLWRRRSSPRSSRHSRREALA